ncbi:MAG TPA: TonB-dependent receptor, partial [Opitutaceae bacterium]
VSRSIEPLRRIVVLLVLTALVSSVAAAGAAARRLYDIAAGDATVALKHFVAQSGEQVVYLTPKVRGVKTNPVRGEFTAREAIDRMVAGTVLVVMQDEKTGALMISRSRASQPQPDAPAGGTDENSSNPMQTKTRKRTFARIASALFAVTAPGVAQETAPAPADETIQLSPFEVNTDRDTGYTAASSLAGGRVEMGLKQTPVAVSVLTREFLDDIAGTNLRDITEWAPNVVPEYDKNQSPFGDFNYRMRGLGSSFPSRNYFLWFVDSDSYNTERFEFSRGPNGVLFGDGNAGGIVTTFTKRPRFDRAFATVQGRIDTYGGWRTTVDVNQPLNETVTLRLNGLSQKLQSWRDNSDDERQGAHLAGVVKLTERTRLRFEGEWGHGDRLLYRTNYLDNASYWDRVTTNASTSPVAPPAGTGVERMSANAYPLFVPALAGAGIMDWKGFYRSTGTGLGIMPDGRTEFPRSPVLSSREFNLQPVDSVGRLDYHTVSAYLEHRFSDDLFVEAAFNWLTNERWAYNETLYFNHWIDLNRVLPNGQPNPKFGVPFADAGLSRQMQRNDVPEGRVLANYKLDVDRIGLKQNISAIVGTRRGGFDLRHNAFRRINTTTRWADSPENIIRVRMYWDEPGRYLQDPKAIAAANPDWDFGWVRGNYNHASVQLNYVQVATVSKLLDDRLTVILGGRHDDHHSASSANLGANFRDPVTGEQAIGALPDKGQPAIIGGSNVVDVTNTSGNAGVVFYPLKWLGLFGNWSQTYAPPTSGSNLFGGEVPGLAKSGGYDLGVKLDLFGSRINGVINYYETKQTDRPVGAQRVGEINRIWENLGRLQEQISVRDTETWRGTGWEFEVTANLTRSWRLMANFSLPETEQIDLYPGLRGYVAQHLATWQAGAAGNPNQTVIEQDIAAIQTTLSNIAEGRSLNDTYDYTANVYTTYDFREGGLKGFQIGGGANLRGNSVIGNRPDNAFDYVYSQEYYVAGMHVAYDHRINDRVRARYQVNVSNLFDNDELIRTSYGSFSPGNSTAAKIFVPDRFRYLDPRRVTFSATFSF